ncbi:MAG: dihydrofolate reductase [Muribaculaceae bacterium]|nr:dihydrofolate reductase [Muribaculaceae bacterium]
MNTSIQAIVAISEDSAIGYCGELLWRIKEDLRHFKHITTGHPVIMGRKTAESFPKALPGRTNIVITRNPGWRKDGFLSVPTLEEAIRTAGQSEGGERVFIIGGGEIYRLAFPVTEVLEVTRIHACAPQADTWFPVISPTEWMLDGVPQTAETADGLKYSFERYLRRGHENNNS